MTTATIREGDGVIEVRGAVPPYPGAARNYDVAFGVVLLTEELALQAEKFGWERCGRKDEFPVVQRDEATWIRYNALSHVR